MRRKSSETNLEVRVIEDGEEEERTCMFGTDPNTAWMQLDRALQSVRKKQVDNIHYMFILWYLGRVPRVINRREHKAVKSVIE